MIRFIPVEDTLAIRNNILRGGKLTLDQCRFPGDEAEGTFHLGYFDNEKLVCIATFHLQNHKKYPGKGYQLRGMATLDDYRGRGIGNQLVNFAIVYLRGQKVNYVWCNARKAALKFYIDLGFEVISDEFEVPVIGPHRILYLKIQ
ncbi:MAG TPA: GNAT family N-acetyltransferase [Mucilaginibacter sp.]|jgi:ribosomal protein S18 acetylase RimI-like enzyme|nr:GNAT family N-acetyltransferase [Mucilaginibacter sp.]